MANLETHTKCFNNEDGFMNLVNSSGKMYCSNCGYVFEKLNPFSIYPKDEEM